MNYEFGLYVFMLAAFLGFELIRKFRTLLHTPLMSLTNAIASISVVGAILISGEKDASTLSRVLGFIAVVAAYYQPGERLPDYRPHAEDVSRSANRGKK